MRRPGAAEGDQREVARIAAALDRDRADRVLHVARDRLVHAPRGVLGAEPERRADVVGDGLASRGDVERHLAGEEVGRVEIAEHEVRVGDRRPLAADAVTDRPRVGARALGPDLDDPQPDARDAAAAGADLDQVDGGRHHRQAGAVAHQGLVDLEDALHARLAALDEAGLGGRPAHVEGDEVGAVEAAADPRGERHAGRRAGLERADREAHDLRRGGQAAVALVEEDLPGEAAQAQRVLQPVEVVAERRLDVGVDHRRARALVLADDRRHFVRHRHRRGRQDLSDELRDARLVLRRGVGVQEGDRDGAHAGRPQPFELRAGSRARRAP